VWRLALCADGRCAAVDSVWYRWALCGGWRCAAVGAVWFGGRCAACCCCVACLRAARSFVNRVSGASPIVGRAHAGVTCTRRCHVHARRCHVQAIACLHEGMMPWRHDDMMAWRHDGMMA
jgi:hypothetical protein